MSRTHSPASLPARAALAAMVASLLCVFGCEPRESGAVSASFTAPEGSNRPSTVTRTDCEVLVSRLCSQFGDTSEVCGLAQTQTPGLRQQHCAAMLGRYEQVVDEALRLAAGRKALENPRPRSSHGEVPAFGPADAKVTIVEFSDFDCADCARASRASTTFKNLYGDSVRFIFRHFPLSKHANARLAAEASLAAQAQGRFWEYHDVLFANQHELQRSALERYAAHVGLDMPEFKRALDDHRFAPDVDADRALGRDLLVAEVPAMFVNGRRVDVPYGVDELALVVDRGLETRKLVHRE